MFTPDDLQPAGPLPSPLPPTSPRPRLSVGGLVPSSPVPSSQPSPRDQQPHHHLHHSHAQAALPLSSSSMSPPLICHPLDVSSTPPADQELDCGAEETAADLDLTGSSNPMPSAEARALDHMLTDPTAFQSLASALDQSYSGELGAFWADLMWVVALPPKVSGWAVAPPIPSDGGAFDPPRDHCLAHPSVHDWSVLSPMARALSHTMDQFASTISARNLGVNPPLSLPTSTCIVPSHNASTGGPSGHGMSLSAPGTPRVGPVAGTGSLPVGGAMPGTKSSSSSVTASITRLFKRAWGSSSSSSSRPHSPSPESLPPSRKGSASTTVSSSPSPTFSLRQLNDDLPPWNGPSPTPSAASSTSSNSTAPSGSPSWLTRKLRPGASPVISGPYSSSVPSSPSTTPELLIEGGGKRRPMALNLSPPPAFDSSLGGPVDLPPLRSAPLGSAKLTLGAWSSMPGSSVSVPPTSAESSLAQPADSNHSRSKSVTSLSTPAFSPVPGDKGHRAQGFGHDSIARRIRYDLLRRYVHRGARCELNLTGEVHAHVVLEWDRCTSGHGVGTLASSCWDPLDLALTQVAREVRRMIRDSAAWTHIFHNPITFAAESLSAPRSKPVMVRSAPESPRTILDRAILEAVDPAHSVTKRAAARTLSRSQRSQPSPAALLMALETANGSSSSDTSAYGRTAPASSSSHSWLPKSPRR
ncbi:hypothetical protein BCR44DRAFT_49255 [Catenaria anguillulae PL171]|uniref:Uncharacterized protein n=1 Tax=Catenaria anguillulae PL171 TaxID=765915 RepID=A0A1Y2I0P1_9FUNG|nr:hypothetical protein BCR44DRAFT_49255 [Catenaria anguillulae PL171]